jgi:hypothetical protein
MFISIDMEILTPQSTTRKQGRGNTYGKLNILKNQQSNISITHLSSNKFVSH